MKRLPKASLAALAACVLVLGACGDDDDNNDDPTEEDNGSDDTSTDDTSSDDTSSDDTEAPSDDTEAPSDDTEADTEDTEADTEDTSDSGDSPDVDDFVRDSLVETLGLSEDQADCLLENMDLSSGETPDIADMQNYFEDCDINPSDLEVGG